MNTFPSKITFLTDDNEAEFVKSGKTKGGTEVAYYLYTKSVTKIGLQYPFELEQLKKLLRDNLIKVEYANP